MSENNGNLNFTGIGIFIAVVFFILLAIYLFFYYTTKIGIFLWKVTNNVWITSTWLLLNYGYFGVFWYYNEYIMPDADRLIFFGVEYYLIMVVMHLAYSIYYVHKNPEYFYYECAKEQENPSKIPFLLKIVGFGIMTKLGYDAGRKIGKSL